MIKTEIRDIADHPMNNELLDKSKLKLLLQSVQGYESNAGFADYYASQYVLFRKDRFFENHEDKIEAVTTDHINHVVNRYLATDKAITMLSTPTLTYSQLYMILSLTAVVILLAIIAFYMRSRRST